MKEFKYRGFMLDSARHFIPAENVIKIIDAAALCGANEMHWHLCDDQGWRIEIKRYPKLTEVGARRGKSCFWGEDEYENNCGFYTQEDVKRIVAHAIKKGMEIIPEIEAPGHESAMLAAYPEYGCRRTDEGGINDAPYKYDVITYAGVFPNLICAGREDSVGFLENILSEICELFPGRYIHIGGDEAVKQHWRRCPDCQRRMNENGLKDVHELQRWLVLRIGEFLRQRGKKTVVWNESLSGGLLPKNFVVQHWLGNDEETKAFLASGGEVIISDASSYYISRPYFSLSAKALFDAPRIPEYAHGNEEGIMGIECPIWGERITNPQRAEYLLFPRLAVACLKAKGETKTWEECRDKLEQISEKLTRMGVNAAPERDINPSAEEIEAAKRREEEKRKLPGMPRVFEICDFILRQEALEKLLEKIEMPKLFSREIADSVWEELEEFAFAEKREYKKGARKAAEQLLTALGQRDGGAWKDIPDDIWTDTLKCFTRFVNEHYETYGDYGFDRGFWTTRQINALLFRIGELEYELIDDENGRRIAVHIPSDAKISKSGLKKSVSDMRAFMERYFPAWAEAKVTCESWLLSPRIRQLLNGGSNIALFQSGFEPITEGEECFESLMQWVYRLPEKKKGIVKLDALSEKTSLQRALKEYLINGGTVRSGSGALNKDAWS